MRLGLLRREHTSNPFPPRLLRPRTRVHNFKKGTLPLWEKPLDGGGGGPGMVPSGPSRQKLDSLIKSVIG